MADRFNLQGHRGARGLFPENTVEGVLATLACGVSSIELDIAVTSDGWAVISHDPQLDPDLTRCPDGTWLSGEPPLIQDLTLAELQLFDVGRVRPGSPTASRFPDQVGQDGIRIPTLAQMLAATAGLGAELDVELKTDPARPELSCAPEAMAELVVATAGAAGALDRLVVRSFDWRGLVHLQSCHPAVRLAWLSFGLADGAVVAQASRGRGVWSPYFSDLSDEAVGAAQALGLRVSPWTVNEPEDMARLIQWGVDGLCTDRPDLARQVMAAHGLALPPSRRPAGPG
jgi:glycerophosphoryl diester phosphodiesterase